LAAQLVMLDEAQQRLAAVRTEHAATIAAAATDAATAGVPDAVIDRITGRAPARGSPMRVLATRLRTATDRYTRAQGAASTHHDIAGWAAAHQADPATLDALGARADSARDDALTVLDIALADANASLRAAANDRATTTGLRRVLKRGPTRAERALQKQV